MDKRSFLCASAALLAGTAAPAAPDAQRIRYGGDEAFAPFESLDAQGRPRGFQIDLLTALGPATGLVFDIQLRPWADTEAAFRAGQVDLVGMVDTAKRREWALFTRSHATPALAVYRLAGQADVQGLADLVGRRIAVLDREAMRDTLATWLSKVPGPYVKAATVAEALAAVQQGHADLALLPRAYADPLLAQGVASGLRASHLNLPLQPYALAVAPGQAALQARLQQGLDALEADGRLEALRVRWLSSHQDINERKLLQRGLEQQRGWTWGVAGASTVGLALMGVGLWQRSRRVAAERARRLVAESALQRAEALLERTFQHHPDPMLVIDEHGAQVRDANAALLALVGTRADTVIGQPLDALGRHIDAEALQRLRHALAGDGLLDAAPLRLQRPDGQARDCLVSAERLKIGQATQVFCILRDITEQLAHDAALRRGYDALAAQLSAQLAQVQKERDAARAGQARAESSLQAFTRSVAHDLKTPLNAVQGFSGLLRQRLRDGHVDEAASYAEHIDRAARRMTAMINALSALARVDRQALSRQTVAMGRLVQDTWDLVGAAHSGRETGFRLDPLPDVQADPDLAAQVWQNLLGNAAKYSAHVASPMVRVDSHRDARGTWYRVTDNGAGFDMAKAQALFQPFQRLHSGSEFEGSGVGLSLVRRIVDHHGGEVRIRSAPGVGTVAEFTLDPAGAEAGTGMVTPPPPPA